MPDPSAHDVLISLAAELDGEARRTDSALIAYAWREAAELARSRAQQTPGATPEPGPVQTDPGDVQAGRFHPGDAEAAAVGAALDAEVAYAKDRWPDGGGHSMPPREQVARLIAGAAPLIVAAAVAQAKITERDRCAALAESVKAEYVDADPCSCGWAVCRGVIKHAHAAFADLLRETP